MSILPKILISFKVNISSYSSLVLKINVRSYSKVAFRRPLMFQSQFWLKDLLTKKMHALHSKWAYVISSNTFLVCFFFLFKVQTAQKNHQVQIQFNILLHKCQVFPRWHLKPPKLQVSFCLSTFRRQNMKTLVKNREVQSFLHSTELCRVQN